MYFSIKQYRDSYGSLARTLSLNIHLFEPWYNLGVLVSFLTLDFINTSLTKHAV